MGGLAPGARAGLSRPILASDGNDVDTAEEAADLMRRAARRGYVRLVFERQGHRLQVSFHITN